MKCKRCSGSGEAFGGTCWDCYGSGEVHDTRYTTTRPEKSSHPALRAEREEVPYVFVPPDPELVKRELALMKEIIGTESASDPVVDESIPHYDCEHEFHTRNYYAPQCLKCGIYEAQFWYSATAPYEVNL